MKQELEETVNKAISSLFVGEVIFNNDEKRELAQSCAHCFEKINYVPTLEEAKNLFVLFVALTQELGSEKGKRKKWTEYIFTKFLEISDCFCDLNSFQNRFYKLMGDPGNVFDQLKEIGVIIFTQREDRDQQLKAFYATFYCHSIFPTSSFETFFEYCFRTSCNYDLSDISSDESLRRGLTNNFRMYNQYAESSRLIKKVGKSTVYSAGFRELAIQYSDKFIDFYERIIIFVNHLLSSSASIPFGDNYLENCLISWFRKNQKKFAQIFRTRSQNRPKIKPDVYYRIHDDGKVSLYISEFCFLDPSNEMVEEGYIPYEIISGKQTIYEGFLFLTYVDPFFKTSSLDISLDEFLNGDDQSDSSIISDLSLTIYNENEELLFDTNVNLKSIRRDFILFPIVSRGDTKKEITSSYVAGKYFLFCPNFENIMTSYPSLISPAGTYLYYIKVENEDILESEHRHIFFFEKETFEHPEFLKSNFPATYEENDFVYDITNNGTILLRMGINDDLDRYVYIIESDISNDTSSSANPKSIKKLSSCKSYPSDDSQIIVIKCHTADKSLVIRIAEISHYEWIIAEKHFIYFEGLTIRYPFSLTFDDSLDFYLRLNDGKRIRISGDETIDYRNGKLILGESPLFKCKIGNSEWFTDSTLKKSWFYNEIKSNDSISLKPSTIDFTIYLNGKRLLENNRFGQEINKFLDDPFTSKVEIVVGYERLGWDIAEDKKLFDIYFKEHFLSAPFVQRKNANGKCILQWDPKESELLGSHSNDQFTVVIYDLEGNEKAKISKLSYEKSILCEESDDFPSGGYEIEIYLNNYFASSTDEYKCIYDEDINLWNPVAENDNQTDPVLSNKDKEIQFSKCRCRIDERHKYKFDLSATYAIRNSQEVMVANGTPVYVGDLWCYDGESVKCVAEGVVWIYMETNRGEPIEDEIQIRYGAYSQKTKQLVAQSMMLVYDDRDGQLHIVGKNQSSHQYPVTYVKVDL